VLHRLASPLYAFLGVQEEEWGDAPDDWDDVPGPGPPHTPTNANMAPPGDVERSLTEWKARGRDFPASQSVGPPANAPSSAVYNPVLPPANAPSRAVYNPVLPPANAPSSAVYNPVLPPANAPSRAVYNPVLPPANAPSSAVYDPVLPPANAPSSAEEKTGSHTGARFSPGSPLSQRPRQSPTIPPMPRADAAEPALCAAAQPLTQRAGRSSPPRTDSGPCSFALRNSFARWPWLGLSLSAIVPKRGNGHVKLFPAAELECSLCARMGHGRRCCPFTPTELTDELNRFVNALSRASRKAPAFDAKASFEEVHRSIDALAAELNKRNPFIGAPDSSLYALRKRLGAWTAIGAPGTVLSWIADGVKLRPCAEVPAIGFKNGPGASQYADFIDQELGSRVRKGQFSVVDRSFARVLNPINAVPKASGGYRLILDCRFPNAYLPDIYFRCENLATVPSVIPQGAWLFTTDLQDAYFHVPMHVSARPLLCFEWRGQVYTTNVLPFGLGLAPWIFTRVTLPVIEFCRSLGIPVVAYLDDFLWSESEERVGDLTNFVRWLFGALGFAVSDKKSVWLPSQTVQFLGLLLDSDRYRFSVPADKMERSLKLIRTLLAIDGSDRRVPVRWIARACGHLISMRLAVSPARVFTRALYACLAEAPSWNAKVILTPEAVGELRFWVAQLPAFNGREIVRPASNVLLLCDASDDGWGAHLSTDLDTCAFGCFPEELCAPATSSTFRELYGLWCALASPTIAKALAGTRASFILDSQAAVFNLRKGGGPVPALSEIVKEIWSLCITLSIDAVADWISREGNKRADALSRYNDHGDWTLRRDLFEAIDRKFGPHTIDLFASAGNAQTERYYAEHWDDGAAGFDALSQDWRGERCWCNPPFGLIGRTLQHARAQGATITLVFPGWERQPWFREAMRDAVACVELPLSRSAFIPGPRARLHRPGVPDWRIFVAQFIFGDATGALTV
jgi:hypothetical protein